MSDNNYTQWYAICSCCEWIAPLSSTWEDHTEQDVRDRGDWVAPVDNCGICKTPVILLLYREFTGPDVLYSSGEHPTSGWGFVVNPTSDLHREMMDQVISENDIRYWLRQ